MKFKSETSKQIRINNKKQNKYSLFLIYNKINWQVSFISMAVKFYSDKIRFY
jgi:hypothetical protein